MEARCKLSANVLSGRLALPFLVGRASRGEIKVDFELGWLAVLADQGDETVLRYGLCKTRLGEAEKLEAS